MKPQTQHTAHEPAAVVDRYARRDRNRDAARYSPLNPAVYLAPQERERALIRLIHTAALEPLANKQVLEIGCGSGGNLLQLIKLGFQPANLVANELLEERLATAHTLLLAAVTLIPGDASVRPFADGTFDIWRLTLAPPISRAVTRLHPGLYHVFNLLPVLRTHLLCWIAKPAPPP